MNLQRTAFIVEDDPYYSKGISQQLTTSGYDVKCFTTGRAVANSLERNPDLVVLDHELGTECGLKILKEIRQATPSTPVLFLSERNNAIAASQALHLGAFHYLEKDGYLFSKLKSALEILDLDGKKGFTYSLQSFRKSIFRLYNF